MEISEFEGLVQKLLKDFYRTRIQTISKLRLKETLTRKNPYLYKGLGVSTASQLIREILTAYMSSSDEGNFGKVFFEGLGKALTNGLKAEGLDAVFLGSDGVMKAMAIKSGPNVFNSSSRKKQIDFFNKYKRIETDHRVDAIVGYGYGRKVTETNNEGYREIAGQVFWEELTSDPDFYLKIIQIIKTPSEYLDEYNKAFENAVKQFTEEFAKDFCFVDGSIDWDKLAQFNSGRPCKKINIITPRSSKKALAADEKLQIEVITTIGSEDIVMTGSTDVTYDVSDEGLLTVTVDGWVYFNEGVEPGAEVKVVTSCYGRAKTQTFSLKKERKNSSKKTAAKKSSVANGQLWLHM